MVKIRLMGMLDDVLSVKKDLEKKGFMLTECSKPYKNRSGDVVRMYVTVLPSGCIL